VQGLTKTTARQGNDAKAVISYRISLMTVGIGAPKDCRFSDETRSV